MLHFTKEGRAFNLGLNIYWERKPMSGIVFKWVWYNVDMNSLIIKKLRIMLWKPGFMLSRYKLDVIQAYLFRTNQALVTQETWENTKSIVQP